MNNYSFLLKHIAFIMSSNLFPFVQSFKKDFSRTRIFSFPEIISFILGMAGNSLNKELYNFFKNKHKSATASAFVQQRAKIKPYAFEYLFKRIYGIYISCGIE